MPFKYSVLFIWLTCAPFFLPTPASCETVSVAVASNFRSTLQAIAREFESNHPYDVAISSGSSGKLYAQLTHGAPFDLFLSADQDKPRLLEERDLITPHSRTTYATGQLSLWSPSSESKLTVKERFERNQFQRLAIANPKVAPYGHAAESILERFGSDISSYKKVVAENVSQVFHFVKSGNVDIGFVSLSQLNSNARHNPKVTWLIPLEYYTPIKQDMVLLKQGERNPAAVAFYNFLLSAKARDIMTNSGYIVDSNND